VIIDNLDITRVTSFKSETDAPLIVNTNAPLSLPFAPESFKPVAGRNPQVLYSCGNIHYRKFPHGCGLNTDKPLRTLAVKHSFRITAFERFDHD
jgi:hypothetical protein